MCCRLIRYSSRIRFDKNAKAPVWNCAGDKLEFSRLIFKSNSTNINKQGIYATILHKNYETASPSPSVNVGLCDYGVIGCQFSWETLPIITTLTEGGGDITLAAKAIVFQQ